MEEEDGVRVSSARKALPCFLIRGIDNCRVRLSAQLYSEHLLDRTAFLDWYFSLLDMANIDTLPLSLLLAGIYWRDLLRVRCTGHRFAEALLGKAQMV